MIEWVPFVTGAGAAIAGGVYVAVSVMVLPALRRRPPGEAANTMAVINEDAERAPFMAVFFGTAAASIATIVVSLADTQPATPIRILGASFYLAGVLSTIAGNVPMNRRVAAAGNDRAAMWSRLERRWTRLNHVRALLSIGGALGLLAPLG